MSKQIASNQWRQYKKPLTIETRKSVKKIFKTFQGCNFTDDFDCALSNEETDEGWTEETIHRLIDEEGGGPFFCFQDLSAEEAGFPHDSPMSFHLQLAFRRCPEVRADLADFVLQHNTVETLANTISGTLCRKPKRYDKDAARYIVNYIDKVRLKARAEAAKLPALKHVSPMPVPTNTDGTPVELAPVLTGSF